MILGPCSQVILRHKRRGLLAGDRPWSVSGLSQLVAAGGGEGEPLSHFSISESALHQLATPAASPATSPTKVMSEMVSSSTMEESVTHTTGAGSSSGAGSLRRRKLRFRKRTVSADDLAILRWEKLQQTYGNFLKIKEILIILRYQPWKNLEKFGRLGDRETLTQSCFPCSSLGAVTLAPTASTRCPTRR